MIIYMDLHKASCRPKDLNSRPIQICIDLKFCQTEQEVCPQVSLIRSLAFDENKAERALRGLDLSTLDAVSWPEFVWEYLHMQHDDLRQYRSACMAWVRSCMLAALAMLLAMTHYANFFAC